MILSLQYLRGIAALMVVYFHVGTQIVRLGGDPLPLNDVGRFGVDIFFVISGAVMWLTTRDGRTGAGVFLAKRLIRIVPLYWTITLFVAAVALSAPKLQSSTVFDAGHLVASLLFVPWRHPVMPGYSPVVIPGWTLNYEMMFYVVFAATLALPPRLRALLTLTVLTTMVAAGRWWARDDAFGFYSDPIILEFGFGILVGMLFASRHVMPSRAALGVAVVGVLVLVSLDRLPGLPHVLSVGLPVALIVGGLVLHERVGRVPEVALLSRIGDASYSIYLTHIVVLPVVALAWGRLGPGVSGAWAPAFYGASLAASIFGGIAAYRFLELPLTSRVRGLAGALGRPAAPACPVPTGRP